MELYHHGILGQKWGVRRFQNSDGTLTDEGKRRYAKTIQKKLQKEVNNNKVQLYRSGQDLLEQKRANALNELISKETLEKIQSSKQELNNYIESKEVNWDKVESDIVDLISDPKNKYYESAKDVFRKKEGYDPGPKDDLWWEMYDLAWRDYVKKNPWVQTAEDDIYKAVDKHMSYCTDLANNILGEYGNLEVTEKYMNGWSQKTTVNKEIEMYISYLDAHPEVLKAVLDNK